MPNWVRNRITLVGDQKRVNEVIDFVKSTESPFDFNKIIPMPEELKIESGSCGEWGMRYITLNAKHKICWNDDDHDFMAKMEKRKANNKEDFEKIIELGKKYLSNLSKYGFTTWYEWAYRNWDTKWNCSEVNYYDNTFEFETAWSFPYNVIKTLSEKFPDVEIIFCYADEDASSNTGDGIFINGEEKECEYPDTGSNRGYEIFLDLHPEYEDTLVYDEDKDCYIWKDEDDE